MPEELAITMETIPVEPGTPPIVIPKAIATALIAVASEVRRLEKDIYNEHDKYHAVSVDAYFDLVRPLMAKHKIGLLTLELSAENRLVNTGKADTYQSRYAFQFVIYHEGGEVLSHPLLRRTLSVRYSGGQTLSIAQSFGSKTFLRSLFLLTGGELDDLDADAKESAIVNAVAGAETEERKARKALGKPATSKLVTFLMPDGDALVLEASGCADRLRPHLQKMKPDSLGVWDKTNALVLASLKELSKADWLALRKMLEVADAPF